MIVQHPVALVLKSYADELEFILESGFTKHLFPGINPIAIEFAVPEWAFDAGALWELEKKKPKLSEDELREWRKGQEFAELVASCLCDQAQKAAKNQFDKDAVRIIVLDDRSDITIEVEKAIKDFFPNAFICDYYGDKVSYLNSLPLGELGLKKSVLKALIESRARRGVGYASWLTENTEDDLLKIEGIGKAGLQNIKDALAEHGVELRKE